MTLSDSALADTPVAPARPASRGVPPPLVLGIGLLAAWWAIAALVDSAVMPTPVTAVERLLVNLQSTRFLDSAADTVLRLLTAYVGVAVVGAVTGFLLGLARFWAAAVSPLLYAVYSVPKIVLFPLFLLFLGLGDASQVGFAFFSGVLPMVLLVSAAAAAVPPLPLKLAASLRMSTPAVITKIVLPSILPAFAGALRLTFGLTFLGLLIAEMFTGVSGLGYELLRNVPLVRMGDIVGEVVLVILIALAPAIGLRTLETRVRARFGTTTEGDGR
ncbi:ABC transporter permease subunit [Pseudonocardia kujensis]|uniref:ABC transporter permease n=1 Tax=Pseudonocardia kujensis TaxID=1128675 RepID=UPI001E39CE42|nr:ABC transporter permease subunit [Pseudonocardia kujensis]MCE0763697.1 ABC transporter permease subunit [Pseudonocardia kujensis]